MEELHTFQQSIDKPNTTTGKIFTIISFLLWFPACFLFFSDNQGAFLLLIGFSIAGFWLGSKLGSDANPGRKLEINNTSIQEAGSPGNALDWRISWHEIKEVIYQENKPLITLILNSRRPFNWNPYFKLHIDSQGQAFYPTYDGRLLPVDTIEIYGYDNLSQIHTILKGHLEELIKQEQIRLENLAKSEIIRQQQERDYFQRIKKLEDIQKISPEQFEKLVATLFKRMGYDVLLTKISRDEGIDLIFSKNGKKSVVQCKRYSGTVGQPIARDLYGSMVHNRAEDAYLITTGVFSLPAQTWASGKPIHLVDGKMLVEWIETILGSN